MVLKTIFPGCGVRPSLMLFFALSDNKFYKTCLGAIIRVKALITALMMDSTAPGVCVLLLCLLMCLLSIIVEID